MSERPLGPGHTEAHQGNPRPTFRLVTFGGPMLYAGTRHLALSPLRAALLGMLAAAPDGVSTARAIKLLWQPAPSSRLRHRISQLIYSLNREFPQRLVVRKHDRQWLSDAIATDYGVLLAAISDERLVEAAELCKRGFLSELTKSPSDAFSEWLDETSLQLRSRIRQAAVEQWTRLTGQGHWHRATDPARVLISFNPYDERALRMLIRAEAMSGRVGEAEAAFHSFVERSGMGDADWSPHAETLSLVGHLHDMPGRASRKSAARPIVGHPLIGRSEELTALLGAMLPRPGDGLRVVVLRGERGIGKTRFAEEALARGLLTGIRVIRSHVTSPTQVSFLDTLLDALGSSDLGAEITRLAEPWRGIILRLLPKATGGTESSAEPAPAAAGRSNRRCLEAVWRLLMEVTRNKPTVLFIDDFQWVDSDSIAGLQYVLERWPSLPLAVVLATRTDSLREKDAVSRLLGGSLMRYEPSEFFLGELSRKAASELVNTISDGRIEAGVRDRIVELSGRNPFFIVQLTNHASSGRRLPNLDPGDFVPAPQSIASVFAGRLSELDDDAERALQLLTVLGHPMGVDTLSELTGNSHDSCLQALDQLQESRLIEWDSRGFVARYHLILHTVYDRMNDRELGRAAGEQGHWKASAKAIELELHIHRRDGHGPEADQVAARARALLDRVAPKSRGPLHAILALHHQGDLDAGLGHAREAIAIARRKRAPDELLRALVRLVAIQGARGLITDPEVTSAVEEGETLGGNRDDFVDHYNLLISAGTGYRALGRLDEARNWFAKAGPLLAGVNVCEAHVALECRMGELALEARELDLAAAHFARARQLWTPGMGRHLGIISHSGVSLTALRMGEMSVAREMVGDIPEPPASWFEDPWVFALFTARLCEWRGAISEGVDAVSNIATLIEASQPAHWARLKFEEALLRLRHSLPQRYEVAETAAEATASLGIDHRVKLLEAALQRARWPRMAG
ncbi:MAG: AAA family ATPase [Gammaproteobacteria bacterium]|nr:AAA family ATPase [Gammaproteobacteria bacterium]